MVRLPPICQEQRAYALAVEDELLGVFPDEANEFIATNEIDAALVGE